MTLWATMSLVTPCETAPLHLGIYIAETVFMLKMQLHLQNALPKSCDKKLLMPRYIYAATDIISWTLTTMALPLT